MRANAVLVMLVRNSEVNDAAVAIKQLEDRFNHKYNYPWVFLNDEPFNERFIQCVSIHFPCFALRYALCICASIFSEEPLC